MADYSLPCKIRSLVLLFDIRIIKEWEKYLNYLDQPYHFISASMSSLDPQETKTNERRLERWKCSKFTEIWEIYRDWVHLVAL